MKLLIVESRELWRSLLTRLCCEAAEFDRLQVTAPGRAAELLCRQLQPNLILVDLDSSSIATLESLVGVVPWAKFIVLASSDQAYVLHRCLQLRVQGLVDLCGEPAESIVTAIRQVCHNQRYFCGATLRAQRRLREDPFAFSKILSDREQRVLRLLGQGLTAVEISDRLQITSGTVQNHRARIMDKLGLHTSRDLMRYALTHGFSSLASPEESDWEGLPRMGIPACAERQGSRETPVPSMLAT